MCLCNIFVLYIAELFPSCNMNMHPWYWCCNGTICNTIWHVWICTGLWCMARGCWPPGYTSDARFDPWRRYFFWVLVHLFLVSCLCFSVLDIFHFNQLLNQNETSIWMLHVFGRVRTHLFNSAQWKSSRNGGTLVLSCRRRMLWFGKENCS